ncbi:hypothetical protein [Guptibacillus hwajinpoensis]|uniref:Uncharacterized protein n=1 Tax=Guptibacillus hwajinpoensis TaxID=208199 RepID=A0A0J6FPT6_9BACL|nr:hypothetical protein [Alkalihalobacillus macyae]KMM36352.1 hypothetical protein AB986_18100 [Alkalihalobacillus macyae]
MDKWSLALYNKSNKKEIGVIRMAAAPFTEVQPNNASGNHKLKEKPKSIMELRKRLAVDTLPNHSLIDLYKKGK